jgi:hypothetical protein
MSSCSSSSIHPLSPSEVVDVEDLVPAPSGPTGYLVKPKATSYEEQCERECAIEAQKSRHLRFPIFICQERADTSKKKTHPRWKVEIYNIDEIEANPIYQEILLLGEGVLKHASYLVSAEEKKVTFFVLLKDQDQTIQQLFKRVLRSLILKSSVCRNSFKQWFSSRKEDCV